MILAKVIDILALQPSLYHVAKVTRLRGNFGHFVFFVEKNTCHEFSVNFPMNCITLILLASYKSPIDLEYLEFAK